MRIKIKSAKAKNVQYYFNKILSNKNERFKYPSKNSIDEANYEIASFFAETLKPKSEAA
jgi:hypothetical protein